MIYFKEDLVARVLNEAKDAHDLCDMVRDLGRIKDAMVDMQTFDGLMRARKLDKELRDKYPCIDAMLDIAQAMASGIAGKVQGGSGGIPETENLKQDYYGIICGTAVKKGIVQELKDMIKGAV